MEDVEDNIDCQDCKVCKAKQKKIAKVEETRSEKPGERLCIDTSSMKTPNARKKYWVLVKDQATCMKWSYFVKNKDNQVRHIIKPIKEINQMNNQKVRFI